MHHCKFKKLHAVQVGCFCVPKKVYTNWHASWITEEFAWINEQSNLIPKLGSADNFDHICDQIDQQYFTVYG